MADSLSGVERRARRFLKCETAKGGDTTFASDVDEKELPAHSHKLRAKKGRSDQISPRGAVCRSGWGRPMLVSGAGSRLFWRFQVEQPLDCSGHLFLLQFFGRLLEFAGQRTSDLTSNARCNLPQQCI